MTSDNNDDGNDESLSVIDRAIESTMGKPTDSENNDASSDDNTDAGQTPSKGKGSKPPVDAEDKATAGQQNGERTGAVRGKDGTTKPGDGKKSTAGAPQDLVDPRTGDVIARAGSERRFYEEAQRARRDLTARDAEVNQLKGRLEGYERANTVATQAGLTPTDMSMAVTLMSAYKKDPIKTLEYMLTEARANGHDVSKLVSGSTIDLSAITKLIDDRLRPITASHENTRAEEEARRNAEVEWSSFTQAFPDAELHEEALARLLQQNEQLTLREAYLTLRTFALERRLDFSKPLAPQLEAGQQVENSTTRRGAPPVGRMTRNVVATTGRVSSPTDRTEDIVKEAMREAGMNI